MILSILICALEERKAQFDNLCAELLMQIKDGYYGNKVEVLFERDNRQVTTGAKRNKLLKRASGKYCVFIDDDDHVPEYYIEELLKAAQSDCDCMAINGVMTTNGRNEKQWFIALSNPYIADYSRGYEVYLRPPNHITPMKKEVARQIGFLDITIGEDYDFCMRLEKSGLLKTQFVIEKSMYHYKFKDK